MAVAVGDQVAAGKELPQPLVAAYGRTGVVDEPDAEAGDLRCRPHGEVSPERRVVHVPLHGRDGREAPQIVENPCVREVAGVEDRLGALEDAQAIRRQRARAAREMRVS
jgi:hypothetical protein